MFVTDLTNNLIIRREEECFDGPITRIVFFPPSSNFQEQDGIKVLVLSSLSMSKVFYNVLEDGLHNYVELPDSDEYDVPTSCVLSDIDFDGNYEIILGTYGEMILVYKSQRNDNDKETWSLIWEKCFNSPIHSIFEMDLTQDGIKELILVTLNSVIVLQHDHDMVRQRLQALIKES